LGFDQTWIFYLTRFHFVVASSREATPKPIGEVKKNFKRNRINILRRVTLPVKLATYA
jgi:hypothetical protein